MPQQGGEVGGQRQVGGSPGALWPQSLLSVLPLWARGVQGLVDQGYVLQQGGGVGGAGRRLDLLEAGLGGLVRTSRCPSLLLRSGSLQARTYGFGQGERLVILLQRPLYEGGLGREVLQTVGLGELRPL